MDKNAYLERLSRNLERWVPESERREIIRWYEEYFDEAGPGREAEIIERLGDPAALARQLAEERGFAGKRGPKLWQVILGAVVVVILSLPLMALRGGWNWWNGFGAEQVVYVTNAPLVEWAPGEDIIRVTTQPEPAPAPQGINISVLLSTGDITIRTGSELAVEPVGDPSGLSWEWEEDMLYVYGGEADVVVTVPEDLTLDIVEITTGVGDVEITGLQANTITVWTDTGDVDMTGCWALGQLTVTASVGDVALECDPMQYIWLETGTGDVDITCHSDPREFDYELSTGLGAVRVDGREQGSEIAKTGGDTLNFLHAQTGLGDVALDFET